jgi:hypothetical protein
LPFAFCLLHFAFCLVFAPPPIKMAKLEEQAILPVRLSLRVGTLPLSRDAFGLVFSGGTI